MPAVKDCAQMLEKAGSVVPSHRSYMLWLDVHDNPSVVSVPHHFGDYRPPLA